MIQTYLIFIHFYFPRNAAILQSNGDFFCGGTLISEKEVLTVAHCIRDKHSTTSRRPEDLIVHLGYHNLSKKFESGRVSFHVKSIRVHPDWNTETDSYDANIAILELDDEVEFGKYIQPICLIDPNSEIASSTNGAIVGFDYSRELGTLREFLTRRLSALRNVLKTKVFFTS